MVEWFALLHPQTDDMTKDDLSNSNKMAYDMEGAKGLRCSHDRR